MTEELEGIIRLIWRVSMGYSTKAAKKMIDKAMNTLTKLVDKAMARYIIVEVYIWWSGKKQRGQ